jgi:hypothetical protein
MTMTHDLGCPEEVLAAIAWYPEGLDAERRGAVESHAADCALCREEISFLGGDGLPLEAPNAESERVYARVLERIEAYESRARGAQRPAAVAREAARFPVSRAAAALIAAAFVGAGAMWLGSRIAAPAPVYETAGAAPETPAAARPGQALDVVFRPDATAERIHAALRAIGGEVISGPTQLGVYRVRLAPTSDASAAARVLRGDGQGVATFAEQVAR